MAEIHKELDEDCVKSIKLVSDDDELDKIIKVAKLIKEAKLMEVAS